MKTKIIEEILAAIAKIEKKYKVDIRFNIDKITRK